MNFTGVGDDEELFSNQNDGGLEIRLEVALDEADPEDVPLSEQHLPVPSWLILRIDRGELRHDRGSGRRGVKGELGPGVA